MQKPTTAGEQPHSVAHQAGAARLSAPSALRNRALITKVLAAHLTASPLRLLEIASGTGQHALYAARALPHVTWQPSDIDPARIASVNAWRSDGPDSLLPAMTLDASAPDWAAQLDHAPNAILIVNLLHLIPDMAAQNVLTGAAKALAPGGQLFLYGPFTDGGYRSEGDAAFDAQLKTSDPSIGYKDLSFVIQTATGAGLTQSQQIEMPANNLMVLFTKS